MRNIKARMINALKRRTAILKFHRDEQGQDILEYTVIVAFAVTVIAVVAALYGTIKTVLTNANAQLQSIK